MVGNLEKLGAETAINRQGNSRVARLVESVGNVCWEIVSQLVVVALSGPRNRYSREQLEGESVNLGDDKLSLVKDKGAMSNVIVLGKV